ncbi:hypothetical protein [Desulfoscipio geothermicus]|nr:hypothetical protein [Desulfoscipio geothermicus]
MKIEDFQLSTPGTKGYRTGPANLIKGCMNTSLTHIPPLPLLLAQIRV